MFSMLSLRQTLEAALQTVSHKYFGYHHVSGIYTVTVLLLLQTLQSEAFLTLLLTVQ